MRKVLKWLAAGVAGLVVAVGAYGVWDTYSNYQAELNGYKSVRWGDSQAEVRYALGMPKSVLYMEKLGDPGYNDQFADFYTVLSTDYKQAGTVTGLPKDKTIRDYTQWSYDINDGDTTVQFNEASHSVERVSCMAGTTSYLFNARCGRLYGYYGDSEEDLVEVFGSPTASSIDTPSGVKKLRWDQLGMEVYLTQRRAYMVERFVPVGPNAAAFLRNWYF